MSDDDPLARAANEADPELGLRAVRSLRALVERLEALQVANARLQHWSWQDVASQLGVSRQAVHKKYAGGMLPRREK